VQTGQLSRSALPPAATLAVLVGLVASHHQDAFAELYSRTAARVLATAMAVLRNVDHAEEVTQEVYLEIWQKAASFDESLGSATAWINRIARSRAIDRVRTTVASRDRETKFTQRSARADVDSVEIEVLQRADKNLLHKALAELTHLQREALTLTYLHGGTYKEVSELLGVPLPTLKTRVRDALRALQCTVV
jgi:RNA polymerase sigma-70 factor (ECF subfamily)